MCHKYGCVFYSTNTLSCDYFLITGKLRGCPATDDCEKYRLELGDERPLYSGFKPRRCTQDKLDMLEAAYQKYGDKVSCVEEFSKKAKIGRSLARGYIRKVHPDSKLVSSDWAIHI